MKKILPSENNPSFIWWLITRPFAYCRRPSAAIETQYEVPELNETPPCSLDELQQELRSLPKAKRISGHVKKLEKFIQNPKNKSNLEKLIDGKRSYLGRQGDELIKSCKAIVNYSKDPSNLGIKNLALFLQLLETNQKLTKAKQAQPRIPVTTDAASAESASTQAKSQQKKQRKAHQPQTQARLLTNRTNRKEEPEKPKKEKFVPKKWPLFRKYLEGLNFKESQNLRILIDEGPEALWESLTSKFNGQYHQSGRYNYSTTSNNSAHFYQRTILQFVKDALKSIALMRNSHLLNASTEHKKKAVTEMDEVHRLVSTFYNTYKGLFQLGNKMTPELFSMQLRVTMYEIKVSSEIFRDRHYFLDTNKPLSSKEPKLVLTALRKFKGQLTEIAKSMDQQSKKGGCRPVDQKCFNQAVFQFFRMPLPLLARATSFTDVPDNVKNILGKIDTILTDTAFNADSISGIGILDEMTHLQRQIMGETDTDVDELAELKDMILTGMPKVIAHYMTAKSRLIASGLQSTNEAKPFTNNLEATAKQKTTAISKFPREPKHGLQHFEALNAALNVLSFKMKLCREISFSLSQTSKRSRSAREKAADHGRMQNNLRDGIKQLQASPLWKFDSIKSTIQCIAEGQNIVNPGLFKQSIVAQISDLFQDYAAAMSQLVIQSIYRLPTHNPRMLYKDYQELQNDFIKPTFVLFDVAMSLKQTIPKGSESPSLSEGYFHLVCNTIDLVGICSFVESNKKLQSWGNSYLEKFLQDNKVANNKMLGFTKGWLSWNFKKQFLYEIQSAARSAGVKPTPMIDLPQAHQLNVTASAINLVASLG